MSLEEEPSIGFICPLFLELKAVLAALDERLPSKRIGGTEYYYGRLNGRKTVALHFPWGDTGPGPASTSALYLVHTHPSLEREGSHCFLVGIAGGIWTPSADVRLGDVVIATRTWDWRSGKLTNNGFVSTKDPERAPLSLRSKLGKFLDRRHRLGQLIRDEITRMQERSDEVDSEWNFPGCEKDVLYSIEYEHIGYEDCDECDRNQAQSRRPRADSLPRVHDGLIASGNIVLKDAISREALIKQRALGVEMEACGVPGNFIVVRGISDYADSHKNDIWQPYAAATAAACTRLLIDCFDGRPYALPSSRCDSPVPPPRLDAQTRAKLFGQKSGSRPFEAPDPSPQSLPDETEKASIQQQAHSFSREHADGLRPEQDSGAAKGVSDGRTQRLIPAIGIREAPLKHYMEILDAGATVERTTHSACPDQEAYLITTDVDLTGADIVAIVEDTMLWLKEPRRGRQPVGFRSTPVPYHYSQAAQRRTRLGRNTNHQDEKFMSPAPAKPPPLPPRLDLPQGQPQQHVRPSITPTRSYGVSLSGQLIHSEEPSQNPSENHKGEKSRDLMMEELQMMMEKLSESQRAMSNVYNTMHENATNPIRNIKG